MLLDTQDMDLSALVASRLCHDLANPLGALGNGLELLQMLNGDSPEMQLLAEAVDGAQTRLELCRLAFGRADEAAVIAISRLRNAMRALAPRVTSDVVAANPLTRGQMKRLCLAALCAESALPRGGHIIVRDEALHAEGPTVSLNAELWRGLQSGHCPVDAPNMAHFAALAATGPVTFAATQTTLTITV